jgi:hypothetical protein
VIVPDDPDLGGLDPQAQQCLSEKRTVQVVAIAADELRAGDDERGADPAQSARTPIGVTVSDSG